MQKNNEKKKTASRKYAVGSEQHWEVIITANTAESIFFFDRLQLLVTVILGRESSPEKRIDTWGFISL
jgi:hypothetical protein